MTQTFQNIRSVEKVFIFGSRASGSFRRGSDIDLAVAGCGVTASDISRIRFLLEEEGPTLLHFDVLHLDTLHDQELVQQIKLSAREIYSR